ncbi:MULTISPECIES: caspase, EACC1-associated type [unclassified Streptomyces]|uniref:caspase family protein n=1 Tax=unclassified Streptomyces TaxID=2593676 RepID=UPI002E805414|nr:caspase family protein [Streptomyces sp. NBC_00562]WUC17439.1 caspase family protein [Streptomyces sp. NBC_00562]WUC25228.1 caspase family protein [Streptomyces sp. NBC_00562]
MSVLPDPGASRAVLIGTSRYEHLEQLPAVSNNLTALAGLLSGPLSLRMPAPNVTIIENPRDPSTVVDPLRQAAAEATDTLLVYYAGHGLIDPHDALALAMPHTQPGRIETSLIYDWLRHILLGCRAQRHIVLLDCCYSGLALGRMSAPQGLADHAAVEGTFLLAASAETCTALAPVGDTHTAFTGALLDTLRHGIPGGPPLLDLETAAPDSQGAGASRSAGQEPQQRCPRGAGTQPSGPSRRTGHRRRRPRAAGPTPMARPVRDQHRHRLLHEPRGRAGSQRTDPAGGQPPLSRTHLHRHHQQTGQPRHAPRHLDHYGRLPVRCGVPDDQIQQWHSAWQELRRNASATQEPRTGTPGGGTSEAGKARQRLSALWRGRGH